MDDKPEITVLTIDIQVRHRPCGNIIILHGDDWGDVYGICPTCDREWWVEFNPRNENWSREDDDEREG